MAPNFPTKPLTRLPPHPCPVHAVTFSAGSGQYILTGAQDRQIRLFNPFPSSSSSGPLLVQTFRAHGHEVLDLAVSPDNASMASVGGDKLVFAWDVATATTTRRFAGHAARVNAVAYAGGGGGDDGAGAGGCSVLVSGSYDGTVKLWDLRARGERAMASWGEAGDSVSDVAACGAQVVAGSVDGRVRRYDVAAGRVAVDVVAPREGVTCVGLTAAGDAVLVGSLDSRLRLMDCGTGRCLQTFEDGGGGFRNVEFRVRSCLALGDACVVSGSEDGRVVVWDVLGGGVLERVWHRERGAGGEGSKRDVVSAVAWNQLRKQWVSAAADGSVVVWGMGDRGRSGAAGESPA